MNDIIIIDASDVKPLLVRPRNRVILPNSKNTSEPKTLVASVAPMKRTRQNSVQMVRTIPAPSAPSSVTSSVETWSDDEFDDDDDIRPQSHKKRKRENLEHLSPAEKLARRKMMNRVAAQLARDRKKTRTENIEKTLHDMQSEMRKLKSENQRLRSENDVLKEIVTGFYRKNEDKEEKPKIEIIEDVCQGDVSDSAFESAELIRDLQQRGQAGTHPPNKHLQLSKPLPAPVNAVLSLILMLALSMKESKSFSNICVEAAKRLRKTKRMSLSPRVISSPSCPKSLINHTHSWGPHNRSWNPTARGISSTEPLNSP